MLPIDLNSAQLNNLSKFGNYFTSSLDENGATIFDFYESLIEL